MPAPGTLNRPLLIGNEVCKVSDRDALHRRHIESLAFNRQ